MRALVVREPGRYAVEELPEPVPGPGEVLVEVAAAGICGSDLEGLDGRRPLITLMPGSRRMEIKYILPAMIGFVAFFLVPTIRGIYLSFTEYSLLSAPDFNGLANYERMVQDSFFWNALVVTVDDDGAGSAAAGSGSSNGAGQGIVGMRERARALGGTLEAGPRPEGGFRVRASLPVEVSPTGVPG